MRKALVVTMITALLVFSAALAGAALIPVGAMSGSGTGGPGFSSYAFSGAFAFDTTDLGGFSWASIMGATTFTFFANSAGTIPAYDYDGYTAGSINKGNKQWIINNNFPSPGDARFYGSIGSFTFDGSGNVTGTLITDGYIHWYYGYDTAVGPPPGMTSLASWGLQDTFTFSGTYTGDPAGFNIAGTVYAAPVPIPGALVLFGSGLLGLVGIGRKRFKR